MAPPRPPSKFTVNTGIRKGGTIGGIYGEGGVGKSSLLASAPGVRVVMLGNESVGRQVSHIDGVANWRDLIEVVRDESLWKDVKVAGLDSMTVAEKYAEADVLGIEPGDYESGATIESFGFGKGYKHIAERMDVLMSAIEKHHKDKGRHFVSIAHATAAEMPNPGGANFLCWQPKLQGSKNNNMRERFREWCHWLAFIEVEAVVKVKGDKEVVGKATGGDKRLIHVSPEPHFWAKNRIGLKGAFAYEEGDDTFWKHMIAEAYG